MDQPARLNQAIADLGLSVDSVFVPWSKSRSYTEPTKNRYAVAENGKRVAHPADRSLNWRVTLLHSRVGTATQGGRYNVAILTTNYTAGIGHAPAYKAHKVGTERWTVDGVKAIEHETETGRKFHPGSFVTSGAAILPDTTSVIAALVSDYSVIDYATYEEWARDMGYDEDSRKGEKVYRDSLENALRMRAALGDEGMRRLQEAAQEY